MGQLSPPNTFLLVAKSVEDVSKLDKAIREKKLELQKIGESVYLGFFFDWPDSIYPALKDDFGIEGEIHWISLPHPLVTK